MEPIKESLTYQEVDFHLRGLAKKILESGKEIKSIVAITRGGLFPATLLCQYLGIKDIRTICLSSYSDDNKRGEMVEIYNSDIEDASTTLFVDDLVDSGATIEYVQKKFPNSSFAVIYNKRPELKLTFPAIIKPKDVWILFPWEKEKLELPKKKIIDMRKYSYEEGDGGEYRVEPIELVNDYIDGSGNILSMEQKKILKYIEEKRTWLTMLTGKAGSGKSTIIKALLLRNPNWVLTATTGKAAILIGGMTLDRFFAYDRINNECFSPHFLKGNMEVSGKVIIVDEASMVGKQMFNYIYAQCITYRKDLILVGDWGQASPVKDDWIFNSGYLKDSRMVKLTECHRQNSKEFLEALDKIRTHQIDESVEEMFKSRICPEIPEGDKYTVLYHTNKMVDAYNKKKVHELAEKTKEQVFVLNPRISETKRDLTPEQTDQLFESSMLAYKEDLCIGCKVVITRNGDTYVNGDTGILQDFDGMKAFVLLDRGGLVVLGEATAEILDTKGNVETRIRGFTIRAGYALTIHKCQGMTIPKVWFDMGSIIGHQHGLCYVAMSRVRNIDDLLISKWNPRAISIDEIVKDYL